MKSRIPDFDPKEKNIWFFLLYERIYSRSEIEKFIEEYSDILRNLRTTTKTIYFLFYHLDNFTGEKYPYKEDLLNLWENFPIREDVVKRLKGMKEKITNFLKSYRYNLKKEDLNEKITINYFFLENSLPPIEIISTKLKAEKERFEKTVVPCFLQNEFPLKRRYYREFIHWNLDFLAEILLYIEIALEKYDYE